MSEHPNQATATSVEDGSPQAASVAVAEHFADARADAVKAVEAAIKAEEEKTPAAPAEDPEAPDEPAAAKSADKGDESTEVVAETPKPKSIGDILKGRVEKSEKTEAQKLLDEARAASAEAKKATEEIAAQRAEIAREKAKLAKLKDLRSAPEALKELGWEPEEFVAAAARANTHEGKLEAMVRQQAELIAELKSKADGWEKSAEEQKATAQRQAEEQQARQAEETFQKVALDAEKFPSIVALYGDEDEREILVWKARNVASRYQAATGEVATFDQIAAYLEEKAAEKLGAQKQAAPKNGKAPTAGRPPGKRSVSSADSSERRSVPAVEKIDDEDERRRRAIAAAEKAMRESA